MRRIEIVEAMRGWPDHRLAAAYRIAKTRLRPFFRDPHAMIALRTLCEERGLVVKGRLAFERGQRATGFAS